MRSVEGKVALVTGASKGMGRQFVAAMSNAGMRVVALARPSPELDALSADAAILPLVCDVTDPRAVEAAVAASIGHFGELDVVVANAAMFRPFAFETASDADIRDHVELNLLGVAWTIRAAIPHLRRSGGHIVVISSESVRVPFPMLTTYAATKAAVETLAQGLRDELRSDGIRVTVLRSGSVSGSSGSASWSTEASQAFYSKILATGHAAMSGEPASPQSMAEALLAVIGMPRDIGVDMMEVRAAAEGLPQGARAVAEAAE